MERIFHAGQSVDLVKESTEAAVKDTIASLAAISCYASWATGLNVLTVELRVPCDFRPVGEAILEFLETPQSDLLVFFNEDIIFPEDAKGALEEGLQEAGIPGEEALLALLVGTLNSPSVLVAHRLKCIQCWSATETKHLVLQLYNCLRQHLGEDSSVTKVLSQTQNFELALDGCHDPPCSEAGIAIAVQHMYEVLRQVRTQKWDDTLEQEVTKLLCRFLLGHMVQDFRCVFSIVQIPCTTLEMEKALTVCHFVALDSLDLSDSLQGRGYWLRTSVVDAKMTSSSATLDGAKELDNLLLTSHSSFEKVNTTVFDKATEAEEEEEEEPMGGHADAIIFDGDAVWKKGPCASRGLAELSFLKLALDLPDISPFVPRLIGVRFNGDEMWLGKKCVIWLERSS